MSGLWLPGDSDFGGPLTSYANSTSTSCTMADVERIAEIMRQAKIDDDLRRSRAYFEVLQMEPCPVCGEKIEYREKPQEHYEMCGHMLAELKRRFPAPDNVMGQPVPFPDLMGMPIYRK